MPEEHNYYEELGIPIDATENQIKEAYKKLAKKYHPDLNSDMPQWASTQMKKLNTMYNILSDPLRRQDYDRKIGKKQATTTSSSYPHGYSSQKSTGLFTAKMLRTAAIGTIASGLVAFLILSFLFTKPSSDDPAPVRNSESGIRNAESQKENNLIPHSALHIPHWQKPIIKRA